MSCLGVESWLASLQVVGVLWVKSCPLCLPRWYARCCWAGMGRCRVLCCWMEQR